MQNTWEYELQQFVGDYRIITEKENEEKIKKTENKKIIKNKYESKYVNKYSPILDIYDTLGVKAAMGLGKTKNLVEYINSSNYEKHCIITFRRTLANEYKRILPDFELYSDVKERNIDLDNHKNIIIQVDSLYRIRGIPDVLILDEFRYTVDHMVTGIKKFRERCIDAFNTLMHESEKVIALDALLNDDYMDLIKMYRNSIYYDINTYKKHADKKLTVYGNDIHKFMNSIIDSLSNNEKIVIASNSKTKLEVFENKINNTFKGKKNILMINSDTYEYNDKNKNDWAKYDVIAYSPSISAGVSFEQKHFDKCYGYFVSSSSVTALSVQQLFRVRNLNKNQIHICVDTTGNNNYPVDVESLDNLIESKEEIIVEGSDVLKIDFKKKNIIKDEYYYIYRNVFMYNNISKNNYLENLLDLLKEQGITNIKYTDKKDKKANTETRKELKSIKDFIQYENATSIVNAPEIDDDLEYDIIKEKERKTKQDKDSLAKYSFIRSTKIEKNKLNAETYIEYKPKLVQFHNLSFIHYNKENFEERLKKRIAYNNYNSRNRCNSELLHYSMRYEKMFLLNELVKKLGWENLTDKKEVNINIKYDEIIPDLKKIEKIFGTSYHTWEKTDRNIRTAIIRYINSRLKYLLDMEMRFDKGKNKYILKTISVWDSVNYTNNSITNDINLDTQNFNNKVFNEITIEKMLNRDIDDDDTKELMEKGVKPIIEKEKFVLNKKEMKTSENITEEMYRKYAEMKKRKEYEARKNIVNKICEKYKIEYNNTDTVIDKGNIIYSGSKWFTDLAQIKKPIINRSTSIKKAIKDVENDDMIIIKKIDGKTYHL